MGPILRAIACFGLIFGAATQARADWWWCRMCGTWHRSPWASNTSRQTTTRAPSFARTIPNRGDDIDIKSTPMEAVDAMVEALELESTDTLYDLGCGDARILIRAAQRYGCQGVGIEIDPAVAALAKSRVRDANLADRIKIVTADARKFRYRDADYIDAVALYQTPELLAQIVPQLPTTRIASYLHRVPGHLCKTIETDYGPIYVAQEASKSWNAFGR